MPHTADEPNGQNVEFIISVLIYIHIHYSAVDVADAQNNDGYISSNEYCRAQANYFLLKHISSGLVFSSNQINPNFNSNLINKSNYKECSCSRTFFRAVFLFALGDSEWQIKSNELTATITCSKYTILIFIHRKVSQKFPIACIKSDKVIKCKWEFHRFKIEWRNHTFFTSILRSFSIAI